MLILRTRYHRVARVGRHTGHSKRIKLSRSRKQPRSAVEGERIWSYWLRKQGEDPGWVLTVLSLVSHRWFLLKPTGRLLAREAKE